MPILQFSGWLVLLSCYCQQNHTRIRLLHKEPLRGVLKKMYAENMQQIYRRTPTPKGCSPVNLLHIFRAPFSKNTSGWLLLLLAKNSALEYLTSLPTRQCYCFFNRDQYLLSGTLDILIYLS